MKSTIQKTLPLLLSIFALISCGGDKGGIASEKATEVAKDIVAKSKSSDFALPKEHVTWTDSENYTIDLNGSSAGVSLSQSVKNKSKEILAYEADSFAYHYTYTKDLVKNEETESGELYQHSEDKYVQVTLDSSGTATRKEIDKDAFDKGCQSVWSSIEITARGYYSTLDDLFSDSASSSSSSSGETTNSATLKNPKYTSEGDGNLTVSGNVSEEISLFSLSIKATGTESLSFDEYLPQAANLSIKGPLSMADSSAGVSLSGSYSSKSTISFDWAKAAAAPASLQAK